MWSSILNIVWIHLKRYLYQIIERDFHFHVYKKYIVCISTFLSKSTTKNTQNLILVLLIQANVLEVTNNIYSNYTKIDNLSSYVL